MKVVIFGGAGGTGRVVVEQALEKGYEVTAFDRHPQALTIQHPKLSIVQGDIFDPAQVEAAIVGQDVVICVLGVKPGVTIPVCSKGTENIVAAMQKVGVKRFICQSAYIAAALDGDAVPSVVMSPRGHVKSSARPVVAATASPALSPSLSRGPPSSTCSKPTFAPVRGTTGPAIGRINSPGLPFLPRCSGSAGSGSATGTL